MIFWKQFFYVVNCSIFTSSFSIWLSMNGEKEQYKRGHVSWNMVRWTFVEEKSFGDCIWWIGFLGNLGWSLSCLGEVLRWCVLVICNGGRPGGGAGGLLDLGCWSRRETPRPISEGRPHRPKLVLQRPVPATFFIADGYWDLRQGPTTFFYLRYRLKRNF